MISNMDIVDEAEHFLLQEIGPRAQEMDGDPETLRWAMGEMGRRNLLAMKRPAEYGGPALSEPDFRRFQESVARVSGALSFLQTQHQSCVSFIAKSSNEMLKQEWLPKMASGEALLGLGFSQLRRPGPPMMRAEEEGGGFRLAGQVPWITGYTFYPNFLIGAALPDGRSVFGIVPLENGPEITISAPMKLAAMESALTVTAEIDGYFLPASHVVSVEPASWIQNNDMINIALQRHFALGCCQAGLDILEQAQQHKPNAQIGEALSALSAELAACRDAASPSAASGEDAEVRLEARAWAIELATRTAHAAIAATGGSANYMSSPAQRVFRESLVYTVSAQTKPVMEATLKRLIRSV